MARLDKQFESATVEWETPADLFQPLNDEFRFTLDVAATADNTKCARFFTSEDDGLAQPWSGVCWMNPPYGREMAKWMHKAVAEQARGVTTVCLTPARTNTNWFHALCLKHGEVRFIRGRPKFAATIGSTAWRDEAPSRPPDALAPEPGRFYGGAP